MRGQLNQKIKTNVTLSLDNDLYDALVLEAKAEGISLNSKINSILAKNVIFYRHEDHIGSITIMPEIVSFFIESIDEKEMLELLQNHMTNQIIPFFKMNDMELTLKNFIENFFQRIFLWSGFYTSFNYDKTEDQLRLIFKHKYGTKWSRIIEKIFFHITASLDYKFSSEILDDMLIMRLHVDKGLRNL